METKTITVCKENPAKELLQMGVELIKKGELVAFPTETVYGLGANGLDANAIRKIFEAKERPADNPLILHVAHLQDVFYLAEPVSLQAQVLMEAFWPGPLTLVLPKRKHIPQEVTAGLDTVAIRMPNHPVALTLIKEGKVPLAAPSANRSGRPSPTTAQHVLQDLNGRIPLIIDGGATGVGLESTVLDCSGKNPVILRPGGVTKEQLEEVIGPVMLDSGLHTPDGVPKAPGMKYTHYAPDAKVLLIDGSNKAEIIRRLTEQYHQQGKRVGLLLTTETWRELGNLTTAYQKNLGSLHDLAVIAQQIYHEFRQAERNQVDIILTETYPEEGLGTALMNRLLKSAGYEVVRT